MKKLIYLATVEKDGSIKAPSCIRAEINKYFSGKGIEIQIKQARAQRSTAQNAAYWAIAIPYIIEALIDLGNDQFSVNSPEDRETIHCFLKSEVLKNEEVLILPSGEVKKLPSSSKRLNTVEFNDYYRAVQRWAALNLFIDIPDPDPAKKEFEL